ncbi:MAG: hypothetical protein ABFC56_01700 [Clostridiaceae bacterium]
MSMLVQHGVSVEIGVSESLGVWTYAELDATWDNLTEALNEVITQWFPAANNGFADNEVTGMAPVYTLTGKRIVGNTAQDFLFTKKFQIGSNRRSSIRITKVRSDGTYNSITCPCTFCNLVEMAGASTDGSNFSAELRLNGAPTLSDTLPELKVVSVAGTAGKTLIYVNPALTGGNTYVYKTAASVDLPALGTVLTTGWTAWNGAAEITAATGHEIAIVEINATNESVKGGLATVTAG